MGIRIEILFLLLLGACWSSDSRKFWSSRFFSREMGNSNASVLQCMNLVDYCDPLFFLEILSIQPGDFCQKVNLCDQMVSISQHLSNNTCEFCHHAVAEVLLKLKDPDTQLEILELLLKECNAIENYAKKCKRLVFEYVPLILVNAQKFLETNDICMMLHICGSPKVSSKQELSMKEASMMATS